MPRLAALLSFAVVALGAAPALAQDAPAPSLAVPTDPEPPCWAVAASADPLGLFLGEYGARLELALGRVHAVTVEPAWIEAEGTSALGIEIGYRVLPMSRGLSGMYLGPVVGAAVMNGADRAVTLSGSLEVGYQHVWRGLLLGAGGGVTWAKAVGRQEAARITPRIVLSLGWAWM